MRQRILAELEAAGTGGISVKELVARLGLKSVNVHMWFYSNAKRHPELQKIGRGRYRLNSASQPASSAVSR